MLCLFAIASSSLNRGGVVEPPNPSLRSLHSTAAQHRVRDDLSAVLSSYFKDNVNAFSQEMASFWSRHPHIV